ncbi:transcription initiation protein spt4 [Crepidotus variabilis]|uniref:Transcription elongation factor SPT4 n=1 Tax=Crepidotus variabilis TaxID=179855 RepID=A0A9P6EC61_9AGAR|nr:transcription initiation protein spt4 [Crepidotus variabilis]
MALIPAQARSKTLRACLLCSLIQTPADWKKVGCPNCEEVLGLKSQPEKIAACTTTQFDGVVAVVDPDQSWVARWQRTAKYVRGMYAVRVMGRIPEEVEVALERRNIKYRPRDQTEMD